MASTKLLREWKELTENVFFIALREEASTEFHVLTPVDQLSFLLNDEFCVVLCSVDDFNIMES